jgi:23S rRNA pseudouridine2605 synthase
MKERSRGSGRVPLERALSKLGLASRSEARRLVAEGRVRVHGRPADDPLLPVVPERASIEVDGVAAKRGERIVVALHKPRGVLTSARDPEGRPTVFDLLPPSLHHLVPVGRLDAASTGLLLFTNDTRLADRLTDPAEGLPRVYLATVRGEVGDEEVGRLLGGIEVDGETLGAAEARVRKRSHRESHLVLVLKEGKNREIRRMMKALGHEVTALKRVSFAGIELGELLPGRFRFVSEEELERGGGAERPEPAPPAANVAPPRGPRGGVGRRRRGAGS